MIVSLLLEASVLRHYYTTGYTLNPLGQNPENINQFKSYFVGLAFKGTVVSRALPSLPGGSLKITLTDYNANIKFNLIID